MAAAVELITQQAFHRARASMRPREAGRILHERDGDPETAARLYAEAALKAPNLAERDHLTRQAKIDGIEVPDLEVDDPSGARTLVIGWGSTYGPITAA
ncbi:hypothetical protein PUR49_00090, partial [Streptomyces sp. BE147]|uniref:hypothetical protein n=1 Tax=Streptomyces sp. BE147 TaxID=3002524 RepID=UPI002E79769E